MGNPQCKGAWAKLESSGRNETYTIEELHSYNAWQLHMILVLSGIGISYTVLGLERSLRMFQDSKVKQTSKGKNIFRSFMTRSQHTNKYKGFTRNIVFLIAASNTSSMIDVHVPHPILNQNNLAFCHSRNFKTPYKAIGNA